MIPIKIPENLENVAFDDMKVITDSITHGSGIS